MRLIDADALRRRMYNDAFETNSPMQKWDGGCWIRYKMFENAIEDAPTIEERKTGEWTSEEACEFCGFQPWYENDIYTLSFCPNCGADMRGAK